MAKLCANSRDPDQMPHYEASDLGLHYLPITLLEDSRLQWVSLEKTKMVSGKQCRPRSDAVALIIGSTLFVLTTGISIKTSINKQEFP